MNDFKAGQYSKSKITNAGIDVNSEVYAMYDKILPNFPGQAIYIYSFKENKMLFTKGWLDILGYQDKEISMLKIVTMTSKRFAKFSNEFNDKALLFLNTKSEKLTDYSFTIELEKIHKNGNAVPVFSRVAVHKALNGKIEEIIGYTQVINRLKLGDIMQYAAYGPEKDEFEESLSKELFNYKAISRKEKEALQLAAKGKSFKEIANDLSVSQSAIEKRIIPMYKRFEVSSLSHLVSFAIKNDIIE